MKRLAAAAAAAMVLAAVPGYGMAATLTPSDWDGLNVREGPGLSYAKIGALAYGDSLPVVGRDGDWVQVRTKSGTLAWVSATYSIISYEDEEAWAVVSTDVLNVREGPSLSDRILTQITEGTRVRLLKEWRDWWRVRLSDGTEGWVASMYMRRAADVEMPAPGPAVDPVPAPEPEPAPAPAPAPDPQPETPVGSGSWEVPELPPKARDNLPLGAKEVWVLASADVYSGRHQAYYFKVDTVYPGERLTYLGAAEGWVQVVTPRGQRGWVPGSAVQIREGGLLMEVTGGRWAVGMAAEVSGGTADPTEWLEVTPWDGLRLRAAGSLEAPILEVLPQGEILQVVQRQDPWVEVITSRGRRGWVHGDYTRPVRAASTPAPAVTFGDGLRATLTAAAPGVLRLEVVGPETLGLPVIQQERVLIPCTTGQAEPALIAVGTGGVRYLAFEPEGVAVGLERSAGVQVVEQAPGRLVVELRPVLHGVQVRSEADRTVYVLQLRGATDARLGAASGVVTVTLPGAINGALSLPPGVQVEQRADGVVVSIPTSQAYVLKATAEGYELHLLRTGLAGKTIVLDPGHGGYDPGAQNRYLGVMEKDVNLAVALKVRDLLVARGARVLLTRATDRLPTPDHVLAVETHQDALHVDLDYRTRIANELGVDAFVSIHHNAASSSTAQGTETYYTSYTLNGIQSEALAWAMQHYLTGATGLLNRGYKDSDFYVTRNTDAPAVLLELTFLTNPTEAQLAMDPAFQQKEAEAIVQALEAFFAAGPQ
ncbi:MAG TPA: N-acetylmuramoyl-L-alanine amidase [Symbiobacteriaceae bacterium]